MRLWTLHPSHLDAKGLVAAWREALLAKAVLRGDTIGYRSHSQLARFRAHRRPIAAINAYLAELHAESMRRGYRFDVTKLRGPRLRGTLKATRGQLAHEWGHLLTKLRARAPLQFRLQKDRAPRAHPLFRLVPGPIEGWERP